MILRTNINTGNLTLGHITLSTLTGVLVGKNETLQRTEYTLDTMHGKVQVYKCGRLILRDQGVKVGDVVTVKMRKQTRFYELEIQ